MAQLYVNIALSSRANSKAEAYWHSHATTAIRNLNAKALLDGTAVSTRAAISREKPSESMY